MQPAFNPGVQVNSGAVAQRALRVAFVTETYPPEVNGVAMTVARTVAGLHRRGHQVQLVRPRQARADAGVETLRGSARFCEVLVPGLPIPRYPDLRMGMPARRPLQRLWSEQRPDVVHIATEGPLGWSALQAARALGLPVTSDFRTNFHAYSQHYGMGWLRRPIMGYLRSFHNHTAATMVPTEPLRKTLQADGFDNMVVVARGVDTQLFNPARRSLRLRAAWGVAGDELVVACVGRLAVEKNLLLLVQAFEAIRQTQPRARLLLVGDGPQREQLSARLPAAVFAGQRRAEDLAVHYASADLFLFPSMTETFGNVTTEAMASGLAVVAFDYAAAAQLISPGANGQLVPWGDGPGFVQAAVALANHPAQRAVLGLAARQRALAQDWGDVIGRFEAVLLQAIQPSAGTDLAAIPATSAA